MKAATVALLAAISTFGCTAEPRRPSPQAESYLNAALDLILEHAMHRDQVDAEELRDRAMEQAAGAELPVDTYPAIRGALVALGDGHSLLELSKELADAERARGLTTRTEAAPALKTEAAPTRFDMEPRMLDTDAAIAYVNLPSTGRWNIQKYAETLSAGVSRLIAEEPCGWIVDLRGNGGGNMWPMLAGIGAVLGEASPGAFVESGEVTGRWFYREGAGRNAHRRNRSGVAARNAADATAGRRPDRKRRGQLRRGAGDRVQRQAAYALLRVADLRTHQREPRLPPGRRRQPRPRGRREHGPRRNDPHRADRPGRSRRGAMGPSGRGTGDRRRDPMANGRILPVAGSAARSSV